MKKLSLFLLVLVVLALPCFTSCNNEEPIVFNPGPEPTIFCVVIKVTQPEYLNYVVAEQHGVEWDTIYDGKHYALEATKWGYQIRFEGRTYQELFLGRSPYIDLGNDYYLVDWKWGEFVYLNYGFLLNVKWEDVEDRLQIWDAATPVITTDNHYEEVAYAMPAKINGYLNISPAPDSILVDSHYYLRDYYDPFVAQCNSYHSISDMSDTLLSYTRPTSDGGEELIVVTTLEDYQREVVIRDSLQNVYVERLKRVIEEGALSQVATHVVLGGKICL